MGQYISLAGDDAIPVRVNVNGTERIGDLEAWRSDDEGNWEGFCRYLSPDVSGTFTGLHLGWFPAEAIRRDDES